MHHAPLAARRSKTRYGNAVPPDAIANLLLGKWTLFAAPRYKPFRESALHLNTGDRSISVIIQGTNERRRQHDARPTTTATAAAEATTASLALRLARELC